MNDDDMNDDYPGAHCHACGEPMLTEDARDSVKIREKFFTDPAVKLHPPEGPLCSECIFGVLANAVNPI